MRMKGYKTKRIIIHCSDSSWGTAEDIDQWHRNKGWKAIGYNAVIQNGYVTSKSGYDCNTDGTLQEGRALDFDAYIDEDEKAAHALSYNKDSIGICLIGIEHFTVKQFLALFHFCKVFQAISPDIEIKGHYEMSTARGKPCPNFNMDTFRNLLTNHIYTERIMDQILSGFPLFQFQKIPQ